MKKYLLSFHSCLRIISLTDNSVAGRKLLRWRLMLMGWGAVADWYHCHRCSLRPIGKAARAPASGFRSPPRDIYLRSHAQHFPALQLHNTTTTISTNRREESSAVKCLVTACPVLVTCSFCCRFMFLQLDNGQHGGFWHLIEIASQAEWQTAARSNG